MVYNCRIDPLYFLDRMTITEVEILIDCYNEEYKEKLEWARLNTFINAKLHGLKAKEPKDLIPFSWDKKEAQKHTRKEIQEAAQSMLKNLKANG